MRVGIVGCGAIHGTHAAALRKIPAATLAGFYDVVPDRALKACEVYGAPGFRTLSELFEACDAVSVCVPSGLHAEVGTAAALAGKHVLLEKPIEVNLAAARSLVDACRSAGVKLSVISQHRFAADIRRLKDAIDGGEMGPLIEGDAYIKWYRTQVYYDSGDWRGTWKLDGGGCLINQGIHYIDMIQWLMGGVLAVRAFARTAAHQIEVEDVAAALVEYKSGATGVIQGSTSFFPGMAERLEVHGKQASAVIEGDIAKVWEFDDPSAGDESPYGRGVQMQPTPNLHLTSHASEAVDPQTLADRWIEQHRLQLQDFVESVMEDREPFITGEMALEPLKVILAIYESARLGGERVLVG